MGWVGGRGKRGRQAPRLFSKFSLMRFRQPMWAAASAVTYDQSWAPAGNGATQTRVVTGLSPGTAYWFVVEAFDEAQNYGGVSNSPKATTTGLGILTIVATSGVVALAAVVIIAIVATRRRNRNLAEITQEPS